MSENIGDALQLSFSEYDSKLFTIEENLDSFAVYVNASMINKSNSGPKTIDILLKNSMFETNFSLDILLPYTDKLEPGKTKSKDSKPE